MNVSRAKNLTILFLVLLNIILFSISFFQIRKFVINQKQQSSIITLLSKNNISIYSMLLTDYSPMKQLSLSQKYVDLNTVKEWLFDPNEEYQTSVEFDKMLLTSESKSLSYDKKQFVFENLQTNEKISLDLNTAKTLCESKLLQLKKTVVDLDFKFDLHYKISNESIFLEYRPVFEGYKVYSSYVKFKVTENGITQIKCSLLSPTGFDDQAREIYSCDVALLALMYQLKSIYSEESIIINNIDLVYQLDYSQTEGTQEVTAIPCYRFYIAERNEPFLINAYYNSIIDSH